MKMLKQLRPFAVCAAVLAWATYGAAAESAPQKAWRSGWASLSDPEALIEVAKELQFNALIVHAPADRMKAFAELARKNMIESYYWISPVVRKKEHEPLAQVMSEEDERRFEELKADKDPTKHGYQFGGEPLPGRHEVLTTRILCFHRPEVVALCKEELRTILDACPDLTGVAFDYFGYQNYRYCLCAESARQFEAWRQKHLDLPRDEALNRFSLETLVAFTNEMADFVRRLRPGARTAIHVYPVFLPEPLYGNRLDVDYCCQTVAWFFKPYWSEEKISRYTRIVVQEQNRYHARARGIPFIGLYVGRPIADKSPERLAEELRIVREAAGSDSLSVCSFNEFVKHEPIRTVAREALKK